MLRGCKRVCTFEEREERRPRRVGMVGQCLGWSVECLRGVLATPEVLIVVVIVVVEVVKD